MTRPRLAVFPKGYFDQLCRGERSIYSWIDEARELPVQGIEMYPDFYPDTADKINLDLFWEHARRDVPQLSSGRICHFRDFSVKDPK